MTAITGEFAIKLDEDKRIKIWVDDTVGPQDTGTYKFWLKPTLQVLLVYNEQSNNYDQVTATVPIVASPTPPTLDEGGIWLDESTSPATFRKKQGTQWISVPVGDIIIGTGGNATLEQRVFEQIIDSVEIIEVLDIPNLLLTNKLVRAKIILQNLSATDQSTIYMILKSTGSIIDQYTIYPGEYVVLEYVETYPIKISASGNVKIGFEGYVIN